MLRAERVSSSVEDVSIKRGTNFFLLYVRYKENRFYIQRFFYILERNYLMTMGIYPSQRYEQYVYE